ncbi:MAG: hypothetical protein AB1792_09430 [Candidatus Zixiibacteriota bacterium]
MHRHIRSVGRAVVVAALSLCTFACGSDKGNGTPVEQPYNRIAFTFFSAGPLESDNLVYQVWAQAVSGSLTAQTGSTVSLGRFRLRVAQPGGDTLMYTEGGTLIAGNTLSGLPVDLGDYDSLFVTIEPSPDTDTLPSGSVYLRGDIPIKHGNTIGSLNFPVSQLLSVRDSLSRFIFATPTDEDPDNELSGVWFVGVERSQGLHDLVALPSGWIYEGWAWHGIGAQRMAYSTGPFADPAASDMDSSHSGPLPGLGFPGEDFLENPPPGAPAFPLSFASGDGFAITIEPVPDPDPSRPFPFAIFTSYDDLVPGSSDLNWLDGHPEAVPVAQSLFIQQEE